MSEKISHLPEVSEQNQAEIDHVLVKEWVANADAFFDKPFFIDRGNGAEEVFFYDAVNKRGKDDLGNKAHTPVVVFYNPDGSREEVTAENFLNWRGLDSSSLTEEIESAKSTEDNSSSIVSTQTSENTFKFLVEQSQKEQESQDERERKIFASAVVPKEITDNYDDLFSDNYQPRSVELAAVKENVRTLVTDKTREAAEERLQHAMRFDPRIGVIIRQHTNGEVEPSKISEQILLDSDLRVDLGHYLLGKIETFSHNMPPRIAANTQKSSNIEGYPWLRSREYASLLALSMLDGTFDDDRVGSNHIDYDPQTGKAIIGQHRAAAFSLLEFN